MRACVDGIFLVHILTASAHVRRHHVSMTHIESKLKTYTMSGPSLHIDFEGAKGGGMCANQRRMGAGGDFVVVAFFIVVICCLLLFCWSVYGNFFLADKSSVIHIPCMHISAYSN